MASEICPEARGCIPQELMCWARVSWDGRAGVSFWKRLWRSFSGYYDCPNEGLLEVIATHTADMLASQHDEVGM